MYNIIFHTYERGDKNAIKSFDTETQACEYVLIDAIRIIEDLRNAHRDVVRNHYLGLTKL